jgi:hypothetical protein
MIDILPKLRFRVKKFVFRFHPRRCSDCERCLFDPKRECNVWQHPHCDKCGHCRGRHY